MPTDADTTANAQELWQLVRAVQDTIDKDGSMLVVDDDTNKPHKVLCWLRHLADELDPDYGRF